MAVCGLRWNTRWALLHLKIEFVLTKPFRIQQLDEKLRHWLSPQAASNQHLTQGPAEVTSLAHRPILDVGILREVEQGDAGMAACIMQVFQRGLVQDLALVEHHLAAGDCAGLISVSHKIKGSSGSIGALALQALASELNVAAHASDLASCRPLVAELHAAAKQVLAIQLESLPNLLSVPQGG